MFWFEFKFVLCFSLLLLGVKNSVEAITLNKTKVNIPKGFSSSLDFVETFQDDDVIGKRWILSENARYEGQEWKHEVHPRQAYEDDKAILVGKRHKHYGLVHVLEKPIQFKDNDVVLQFETRFHNVISCSGAYIKFLAYDPDFKAENLEESTPYVVMFGPDACGDANKKVHLIFRHQNPKSGVWEERHCKRIVPLFKGNELLSHLYTLELRHDNQSFRVLIDGKQEYEGSVFKEEHFNPPFIPPEMIDDPNEKKPDDWIDNPKMPDPDAVKPDDWDESAPRKIADVSAVKPQDWLDDEPKEIPDTDAVMPVDWSEEDDGKWEPPMIPNPKCASASGCGEWKQPLIDNPAYKGKWSPPMIDNPAYKGPWKPKKIKNPDFYFQEYPLDELPAIGAIAIEILANEDDIQFDNIVISTNIDEAKRFATATFEAKQALETDIDNKLRRLDQRDKRLRALNEGGISGMFEYAFGEFADLAQDHTILVFVVVISLLVFLIYFCFFFSTKRESDYKHKKDDEVVAEEVKDGEGGEEKSKTDTVEDDKDEGSGNEDEKEAPKVRRRTRRAD